jgi:hypothetical protein
MNNFIGVVYYYLLLLLTPKAPKIGELALEAEAYYVAVGNKTRFERNLQPSLNLS